MTLCTVVYTRLISRWNIWGDQLNDTKSNASYKQPINSIQLIQYTSTPTQSKMAAILPGGRVNLLELIQSQRIDGPPIDLEWEPAKMKIDNFLYAVCISLLFGDMD